MAYKVVSLKALPTKLADCVRCQGPTCVNCGGTGKVTVFDRDVMTAGEHRRADRIEQVERRRKAEDLLNRAHA